MDEIFELLKPPKIYEEGSSEYWTNPLLMERILKGHLNENIPGGSKSNSFMEDSISFITNIVPKTKYPEVIDLGCGPGLYCQKLARIGYKVTGIDISSNSIRYAKGVANNENLSINYRVQNILDLKETNKYDIALLIYHIYGSFSPNNRKRLVHNVYKSLKKGGIFIIDVASEVSLQDYNEKKTWDFVHTNEALPKESQLSLRQDVIYPDNVLLKQTNILIKNQFPMTFNIWEQYFKKDCLIKEFSQVGFEIKGIYSDVCGKQYNKGNEEIAIVLEKV